MTTPPLNVGDFSGYGPGTPTYMYLHNEYSNDPAVNFSMYAAANREAGIQGEDDQMTNGKESNYTDGEVLINVTARLGFLADSAKASALQDVSSIPLGDAEANQKALDFYLNPAIDDYRHSGWVNAVAAAVVNGTPIPSRPSNVPESPEASNTGSVSSAPLSLSSESAGVASSIATSVLGAVAVPTSSAIAPAQPSPTSPDTHVEVPIVAAQAIVAAAKEGGGESLLHKILSLFGHLF